tara:strand:+ start:2159 stop:2410 length:252 start_codon:yes stop_codon:yes gene_type:complete
MSRVVKSNGIIYKRTFKWNPTLLSRKYYIHAADSLAYWSYLYYKDKQAKHIVSVQDKFNLNEPHWNDAIMVFKKDSKNNEINI